MFENTTPIEPPHNEKYHLTEDMVDKALTWLKQHQAFSPDKPFLMYWAPGAVHGPHHVSPAWIDKYKGKFDDGWDAYRERVIKRQKALGWIPADTKLTPRHETMASWASIPEEQRAFQRRLMEVFAGFVEHTDAQVGKLVNGLEELGLRDNTIIIYIWGDNGSSAEGQQGTISELLAQNNLANTVEQQLAALRELGSLDVLGSAKVDNMYHAGWAWAGSVPFRSTKLVAAHFGGTRNPMVISWPRGIKPNKTPRAQFHHVNDIPPTLYEVIGIKQPKEVNGFQQDPMDGVSMVYTFAKAKAPGQKTTQYFENNASRGVYHDGWYACTFGPFIPWDTPGTAARLAKWDANKDEWELYDLRKDFSQADNLAAKEPERLAKMQEIFLSEAKANKVLPIGGGLWTRFHPEDVISPPYTSWRFDTTTTRMPEFTAPDSARKATPSPSTSRLARRPIARCYTADSRWLHRCWFHRADGDNDSNNAWRSVVNRFRFVFSMTLSLVMVSAAQAQDTKPNILVIFGDDIGYMNVSSYGGNIMGGQSQPGVFGGGAAIGAATPTSTVWRATGIGPFYDGVVHFFVSLEELAVVIALALLGGLSSRVLAALNPNVVRSTYPNVLRYCMLQACHASRCCLNCIS